MLCLGQCLRQQQGRRFSSLLHYNAFQRRAFSASSSSKTFEFHKADRFLLLKPSFPSLQVTSRRSFFGSSKKDVVDDDKTKEEDDYDKLTLGKKFKRMWRDYWYVLLPVHVATSVVWYGGFYFMCKSGVDVTAILQSLGTSETYLEKLRSSDVGYYALAYACYKIATPARYTVTLGGTTISISYLKEWGYLKTTKELGTKVKERRGELRDKYESKKDKLREKYEDKKGELKGKYENKRDELKEKYKDSFGGGEGEGGSR